jgi:hypothetical protein
MGGAFTAVADDDGAIFYNPANLAGDRGYGLNLASTHVEISNDIITSYADFGKIFKNLSVASMNQLLGKKFHTRASAYASLTAPYVGIAVFYDAQVALRLQNQALPQGQLEAMRTYGTQFGVGIPVFKPRKKSWDLRLGFAGKVLWRSGGVQQLGLTNILTLNAASLMKRVSTFGTGLGVDLGSQFSYPISNVTTLLAAVVDRDIGDTSFTMGADPVRNNLSTGLGLKYKAGDARGLLSFEYDHWSDNWDWKRKLHLGAEMGFLLFRIEAGMNQGYFTYGAGLKFLIFHLMYTHYVEELANISGIDPEQRTLAYIGIKIGI